MSINWDIMQLRTVETRHDMEFLLCRNSQKEIKSQRANKKKYTLKYQFPSILSRTFVVLLQDVSYIIRKKKWGPLNYRGLV